MDDKGGLITWLLLHPCNLLENAPSGAADAEATYQDGLPGPADDGSIEEAEDPEFLPLVHDADNWPTDLT
eukprot:4935988-Pyramimonas_sp.AAC.1